MRIDDRNDAPAPARTHPVAGTATSWRLASIKRHDKLACPKAKFRSSAASDRKLLVIDSRPDAFRQRLHDASSAELLSGLDDDDPARVRAVIVRAYPDRATPMAQAEYGPRP